MNIKLKHGWPGFVVGAERVCVCWQLSAERVGGAKVACATQAAPVAGLAPFFFPRHTFQQPDLLLFLLPLGLVPQLPVLPLKWVAVAWERGILLWQGVTDISERVTVGLVALVAWHLTLGAPVRTTWTRWKSNQMRHISLHDTTEMTL